MDTNETLKKLAGQLTSVLKGDDVKEMRADEVLTYSIEQITKASQDSNEETRQARLTALHTQMTSVRKTLEENPDATVEVEVFAESEVEAVDPTNAQYLALSQQFEALKAQIEGATAKADEVAEEVTEEVTEETTEATEEVAEEVIEEVVEEVTEEVTEETAEEETTEEVTEEVAEEEVAASADEDGVEKAEAFSWPTNLNTPEFRGNEVAKSAEAVRKNADRDWGKDPESVKDGYFENRPR